MSAPLEGILVVDFSQFLAGPYASLKLLDMGARVIKVENPAGGDLCRQHYISDTEVDGDSTIFHAINRGKESIALDLKGNAGIAVAKQLIAKADILIQNFRPGVMERLGLGYDAVRAVKPDIIYGSVSGYGETGEWAELPGQDLLAQARSGIMWLNGNANDGPVPLGVPIADISAGANLAQGLLGALFQRATKGEGALIETSLLESLIDLQFEFLTTYFNNNHRPPQRLSAGSAHGYLAAPYGVYQTQEGFLVLAMVALDRIANALELDSLRELSRQQDAAFAKRDEIFSLIQSKLITKQAAHWEAQFSAKGIWCAEVLDWPNLLKSKTFSELNMVGELHSDAEPRFPTIRSPIRISGRRATVSKAGPKLDEDGLRIRSEFDM